MHGRMLNACQMHAVCRWNEYADAMRPDSEEVVFHKNELFLRAYLLKYRRGQNIRATLAGEVDGSASLEVQSKELQQELRSDDRAAQADMPAAKRARLPQAHPTVAGALSKVLHPQAIGASTPASHEHMHPTYLDKPPSTSARKPVCSRCGRLRFGIDDMTYNKHFNGLKTNERYCKVDPANRLPGYPLPGCFPPTERSD